MVHRIIAFAGYPGHGKSTAAAFLRDRHDFTRLRFAGPLKDMLLALPGITESHTDGALKEIDTPLLAGRSPRYAMEHLGTSWGRSLMGGDFWIQQMRNQLECGWRDVVIDDMRFLNEADMVREQGGMVIKIARPECPVDWSLPANQDMESIVPDHLVLNNGTVEELELKVRKLVEGY